MDIENVIIIGGGPSGLAASVYNARADLKPLVIAGSPPGGQLMLTTEVENYPGFRSILGPELISQMRKHTEDFGTRFIDENVESIDLSKKPYSVKLSNSEEYKTKSIIIATGASAMWLNIESEQRLRGKGVSACATCDGFFFKDKIVAVVGGGDVAMEEASFLTKFASKVYVIHRRNEFRASKVMQKRVLKDKKIEVIWNAEVEEVLGEEKVSGVKLKKSENAAGDFEPPQELTIDGIFIAIGHKPNTSFLKDSGLIIDKKGYLFTGLRTTWEKFTNVENVPSLEKFRPRFQNETNIEGVFAAGDVVDYTYRQATTAIGMGVAAAIDAERYIDTLE